MDSGKNYSTDVPLEYDVEKRNRIITPFIRIESAIHFKKMAEKLIKGLSPFAKISSVQKSELKQLIQKLIKQFPLDPFVPFVDDKDKTIDTLKTEQNENLHRLYATYGNRIFDGYKLFLTDDKVLKDLLDKKYSVLITEYKNWFRKKYTPIENEEDNCWNEQKFGYDVSMGQGKNLYVADNYHTGRLSWYSFDSDGENGSKSELKEEKLFTYLPVPADFPGAPNRRLWQFEDGEVQFGNYKNSDFNLLANAVIMQYTSMYSNDWMITPLEAEAGTILNVEGILITDTFGERVFIDTSAEETDNNKNDVEFSDRWSLFGTTMANAYQTNNFSSQKGLLFPPTLIRTEESRPIEEIQFLRDEMANMVWGVETIINDGCGSIITGQNLSDAVLTIVDEQKNKIFIDENDSEYFYLFQNRVPIHWIPFLPKKIKGEVREILFQRGRMPVFYNGKYNPVRPSTELLGIKTITKSGNKKVIKPLFINEEEIIGYGVKIMLTAQRTRWFLGESFNWTGAKKEISQIQANSGLMFDELIRKETGKSITLKEK